jgi:membrane fusion protein, multidrug efflux system
MKLRFLLLLLATILFLGGGCKKPAQPRRPAPTVTVAVVKKTKLKETFLIIGKVKAYDEADIVARVGGFLKKTNFDEGAAVKKGDLLFLIEQDQYKANLEKAKGVLLSALATQINAELEYKRQKNLYEKRAVSKRNYDEAVADKMKAQATVMQAKSGVKLAELDLSYTEVRAPFDGYVGLENYSIGNYVGPTSGSLTSVVSMGNVRVEFNISDKLVLKARAIGYDSIKSAEHVKVILYTADGIKYDHPGEITFWDNQIDQDTGTLTMQAMFPNPRLLLIPGMYVRVAIDAREKDNALVIPRVALAEDITGYYVMVVGKDNVVRRQKVILGIKQSKKIEVVSGLKAGERVVVAGLQHVRPGMPVRIGSAKKKPVTKTTAKTKAK